MARVLLAYSRPARFVVIDRDLLAERHDVSEYAQPGPLPRPLAAWRAVRGADVVVCWFASWHAPVPLLLARLLRRPSILIVGGFDTANMPEIGYGFQQGGIRRMIARTSMRLAGRLLTNSEYSREELRRNTGFAAEVVYHGIPDPFPASPPAHASGWRSPSPTSPGSHWSARGCAPSSRPRHTCPTSSSSSRAGGSTTRRPSCRRSRARTCTSPAELTDGELDRLYARASVYVQASRHEGFGMTVAEAMLAGCIPVVTAAGALPEVVGDTGVVVESPDPADVAAGVNEALGFPEDARSLARERVLDRFPLEVRRRGLLRLVDEALAERPAARGPRA